MVSPRKDKCLDKNMLAAGVSTETTPFVYSINKASPHILGAWLMRSGAGDPRINTQPSGSSLVGNANQQNSNHNATQKCWGENQAGHDGNMVRGAVNSALMGIWKKGHRNFLVVQRLRLCAPSTGGSSSIPGQGTRYHIPQLRPSTDK